MVWIGSMITNKRKGAIGVTAKGIFVVIRITILWAKNG